MVVVAESPPINIFLVLVTNWKMENQNLAIFNCDGCILAKAKRKS